MIGSTVQRLGRLAAVCITVLLLSATGPAQSLWQVTPYNVTVWVAFESHPEIPSRWQSSLVDQIQAQCDATLGAVWKTNVSVVPGSFRFAALSGATPSAFELIAAHETLSEADKLFVLSVETEDGGFKTAVRELDTATRNWSDIQFAYSYQPSEVPLEAFRLMSKVFLPLAEIVRVEDTAVTAEVRAGALTLPDSPTGAWQNPIEVQEGDFLLPYIRKTDRDGKVKENGVSPVKFTVLLVEQESRGTIECVVHSGYRQAFKTRRSSRTRQLALVGRNTGRTTVLHLHERSDESSHLVGYEVYAREPGSEKSTFVGRTDWRGELVVPSSNSPVRILFVKSGSRVLAKLPVVPGLQGRLDVGLRDDAARLEAEGFLLGVQESLVDLVARREILTLRVQQLIKAGRYDDAEPLINELRRLPSREDFENLVQQRKQLLLTSDSSVQDRIDQLFSETRQLFEDFLNPGRVQDLQNELRAARNAGPPAETEESEPASASSE